MTIETFPTVDYKQELRNALMQAPASLSLFRERLTYENISNDLEFHISIIDRYRDQVISDKLKLAAPELGFRITGTKFESLPLTTNYLLKKAPALLHVGYNIANGVINTRQVARNGIWGNISPIDATYLKLPNSQVRPNSHPYLIEVFEEPVKLIIQTEKLLSLRTVFSDPEQLITNDPLGESFIVFGGIPAEAIVDVVS